MKKTQEIHELELIVTKTIRKLKKYSSCFEVSHNFKFTSREEDIKTTQQAYKKLLCGLLKISERADSLAVRLSSLTYRADAEMNVDDIAVFFDTLEQYRLWRDALTDFIHSNDELFANSTRDFKYSALISYARIFSNKTESFSLYLKAQKNK